ncbi:sigma-70 family RNA polymerase sigma factor [Anaerosporobacter faecicola]|uniref:sigma-70 family RNA polymerase sigma factor n=1 Tax=Anaerosporobacter faecicola TaxID=2718714 RepID=UPI00143A14CA|nr:sigma-70 family RNA polymerase sigma factor [Anaerosporobacter faecicola]
MTNKRKESLVEHILLSDYNQFYRLAFSYTKNESDSLDIVQNGAYKAILHSDQLKQQSYAKTWVYRIMLNEIFRFLNQPTCVNLDGVTYEEAITDPYANFDLQQALDMLPKEDKLVISLRYFEDMKLEDIAKLQQEPVSTIKSRLYRGLKKLRIKLEE